MSLSLSQKPPPYLTFSSTFCILVPLSPPPLFMNIHAPFYLSSSLLFSHISSFYRIFCITWSLRSLSLTFRFPQSFPFSFLFPKHLSLFSPCLFIFFSFYIFSSLSHFVFISDDLSQSHSFPPPIIHFLFPFSLSQCICSFLSLISFSLYLYLSNSSYIGYSLSLLISFFPSPYLYRLLFLSLSLFPFVLASSTFL